jgi:hypothetical protein
MQQRRVRLGDVLDDYCPRERRITNHAVVAMIEDEVKQTRCTTCDAEHEYKHAKIPSPRRKKPVAAVPAPPVEATDSVLVVAEADTDAGGVLDDAVDEAPILSTETMDSAKEPEPIEGEELEPSVPDDEWPVHRPLIRATLPRPEGQAPERKPTDFTIRQTGGRFDGQRNGTKSRGNRHGRQAQGQASGQGQSRFGSSRHGSRPGGGQHTGNQPQRPGNRQGPSGQRGGRPSQGGGGHNRGGQNRGPKRGR